ncbi:MAG: CARDB domain-containing protein [Candidatus Hodarchaeota archaeon]
MDRLKKKFKGIFLLLCLTLILLLSFNAPSNLYKSSKMDLNSTDQDLINYKNLDHTFIYTLNGKQYLAEYITKEQVEEMKKDGLYEETKRNYNEIIDGHGTGYSKPTEEELESLMGKISLLGLVSDYKQGYKATADISTEMYFPVVGDQGLQGSCTSWANVYYAFGYLEAKDYGWDASSGNTDYLLSPAWSYNKIAAFDYGSMPVETAELIKEWGVATLSTMPYDDMDVDSWGDEAAWREAPYHRPLDYNLITYIGYSTIDVIKSILGSGIPVTIGIDAYQFYNGLNDTDYILSSDEYNGGGLNHAQCFVGYDDTISEGSDVGAFRVVNSWGAGWIDDGYYWLTYDAFDEFGAHASQFILYLTDRIDYDPNIIATWKFSSKPTRMSDIVTLGVGPHNTPLNYITPHYDADFNNLFPEFMAFDITDFYTYYNINNDVFFYLEIGPANANGIISSFKLERYLGGILQQISQQSPDVPENTPGYVNATFMIFNHELNLYLKVPTNPKIYNSYQIEAIVINNGASGETNVDFDLLLNNVLVHSTTIPNLPSGTNTTIDYLWTPTEYEVYNFTAYVPPVPGETYRSNNYATELLYVLGPIFSDDFERGLSNWVSISGLWHLTDNSSAWQNPYHSPIHSMWFGNESTGNFETNFREFGDITSISIDLSGTDIAFLEFYHWREGEGGSFDSSNVYISIDGFFWDLIYQNSESYVNPWEKVSIDISAYAGNPSVQIMFEFDTLDEFYNDFRGWLIDDIVILGTGVVVEHDLRVSLEVPDFSKISNTYTIKVTITNTGKNEESNVDLFLYLDGILIDSIHISNFPSGSIQTINYLWTPTAYGDYHFKAYAPPVIGETYTIDNIQVKVVPLHKITLFDGLILNYTFTIFGQTFIMQYMYSSLSEKVFHLDYSLYNGSILLQRGYWDVNCQTRIMTDSLGGFSFGSGTHTPLWIFTDSSIGDEIPISVAGSDHTFNVSDELTYNNSVFGIVDVWVLEDLNFPGGIAWYEKNTGFLLNSTFIYEFGMITANYSLILVSTNYFEVEEEGNGIPGYNLLLIIASLGVIILLSTKVKFKKIKNY